MTEKKDLIVDTFNPYWYQAPIINAIERDKYKKAVVVLARRAGKDVVGLNLMLRMAFKRVGVYYYIFPTLTHARRAIWNSILDTGERFISFIPEELILKKNELDMRIELVNGSMISFNGANKLDGLRGTNPVGVVFSEYAEVDNSEVYTAVIRPILAKNRGWALFISTPKGHSPFYHLFQKAQERKNWYSLLLNVEDTKHVDKDVLAEEKEEMPLDLYNREYMCSFDTVDTGAFYPKHLNRAYKENRIGFVPHDIRYKVNTSWDLGWNDPSVILFFQVIGQKICIIDCYKKNYQPITHYLSLLDSYNKSKGYVYGQHFVPFDAENHDPNSGITRVQTAKSLGVEFRVLNKHRFNDGINNVYSVFNKIWINEDLCFDLLDALENYSRKWDKDRQMWKDEDRESKYNDVADAFRYLCASLHLISDASYSREQREARRQQLTYGRGSQHGHIFSND